MAADCEYEYVRVLLSKVDYEYTVSRRLRGGSNDSMILYVEPLLELLDTRARQTAKLLDCSAMKKNTVRLLVALQVELAFHRSFSLG